MTGLESAALQAFSDPDLLRDFWPFFWIILLLIITQWVQGYRDWKMRTSKDKIIMWSLEANRELQDTFKDLIIQLKVEASENANQHNLTNQRIETLENSVKEMWSKILQVVWKTTLPDSELIEIADDKVLAASFDKLAFVRDCLRNYDYIKDQDYIKQAVKWKLEKLSSIYVQDLNRYKFSDWTLVWDWVAENFPMDKFLEDIFEIIFAPQVHEDKDRCIHDKINRCQVLMIRYQNKMWQQARNKFNCD